MKRGSVADRIRRLDTLAQDRLTTRQQAAAFAAAISYLAKECEGKRVTKERIYFALETAAQWADGNSMR